MGRARGGDKDKEKPRKKVKLGGDQAGMKLAESYHQRANAILQAYLNRHRGKAEPAAITILRNWMDTLKTLANAKTTYATEVFQDEIDRIENDARAEANKPRVSIQPSIRSWRLTPASQMSPVSFRPMPMRGFGWGLQGDVASASPALEGSGEKIGAVEGISTEGILLLGGIALAAFLIF